MASALRLASTSRVPMSAGLPVSDVRAPEVLASRLVRREVVADHTIAVTLERPPGFSFRAGQYVDITLCEPRYDDEMGRVRSMSIASAPSERDLLFVMRMRDSAFKRSLAEMEEGHPLLIDGPADDLALPMGGERPLVLLAGGVGIAPFLGAVREAASAGSAYDALLLYSNRRPEDAAYLEELEALAARVPRFRLVATMTRLGESSRQWTGETTRLGAPLLEKHLPSLSGPRYYVSGSTGFISGLCQQIERAGVPPGDIRIEMYAGY
jgi:ferredoxin-NADP reductase